MILRVEELRFRRVGGGGGRDYRTHFKGRLSPAQSDAPRHGGDAKPKAIARQASVVPTMQFSVKRGEREAASNRAGSSTPSTALLIVHGVQLSASVGVEVGGDCSGRSESAALNEVATRERDGCCLNGEPARVSSPLPRRARCINRLRDVRNGTARRGSRTESRAARAARGSTATAPARRHGPRRRDARPRMNVWMRRALPSRGGRGLYRLGRTRTISGRKAVPLKARCSRAY